MAKPFVIGFALSTGSPEPVRRIPPPPRAGRPHPTTAAGSAQQRYRCMFYQIKYTPQPKAWAYPEETRRKAIQLYVDGMNLRRIARHLSIHHRTVSLWVKAQAAQLPDLPVPAEVREAEMDELFTFVGEKKTKST